MTAREFIERNFPVLSEERDPETGQIMQPERFVAARAGELELYGLSSPSTVSSAYIASLPFWLEVFGPTFEAAWAEGKRGQALYEALLATPGGTRGWEIYFELWLRRGLFD